jgi:hypothetical protein
VCEDLFAHSAREKRNPKSKANGEGPKLSQQDQAGQMHTVAQAKPLETESHTAIEEARTPKTQGWMLKTTEP